MKHPLPSLAVLCVVGPLAAQEQPFLPITPERLDAAFADASAAVRRVLDVELEPLPPLRLTDGEELARTITAENLPSVRLREPDEAKAAALAEQLGNALGHLIFAKYAWSSGELLVVPAAMERSARALERPALTADVTLRAVLVHELCHALDDRRFDFAARLRAAKTVDEVIALDAVIEGHAQLMTRRVCGQSGWTDGFEAYTASIGAIPENDRVGEATMLLIRASAAAVASAYGDGERFAAAVLRARPETGSRDLFESPPRDAETILKPEWYLDPSKRPKLLYDVEPALDAFVRGFDAAVWTSVRNNTTGKQLASGLSLLPEEDVAAVVDTLRAARVMQLYPTASPQSKAVILVAMEFDSEDSARHWIEVSARLSDLKNDAMKAGRLRITGSKSTPLERESWSGHLQEKTMMNGRFEFEVATIDAMRGRIVLETIYSGDPPDRDTHIATIAALLSAVELRK